MKRKFYIILKITVIQLTFFAGHKLLTGARATVQPTMQRCKCNQIQYGGKAIMEQRSPYSLKTVNARYVQLHANEIILLLDGEEARSNRLDIAASTPTCKS